MVKPENIKVGCIVRMVNSDGTSYAFSDCLIHEIEETRIILHRPYILDSGEIGKEIFVTFAYKLLASPYWVEVER